MTIGIVPLLPVEARSPSPPPEVPGAELPDGAGVPGAADPDGLPDGVELPDGVVTGADGVPVAGGVVAGVVLGVVPGAGVSVPGASGRQPVKGKWCVSAPPEPCREATHTEPLTGAAVPSSRWALGASTLPGQAAWLFLVTAVASGKFHSSLARTAPSDALCSLSSRTKS